MAIPSTNVYLEDIYWEAQFGGGSGDPGSGISFGDLEDILILMVLMVVVLYPTTPGVKNHLEV